MQNICLSVLILSFSPCVMAGKQKGNAPSVTLFPGNFLSSLWERYIHYPLDSLWEFITKYPPTEQGGNSQEVEQMRCYLLSIQTIWSEAGNGNGKASLLLSGFSSFSPGSLPGEF